MKRRFESSRARRTPVHVHGGFAGAARRLRRPRPRLAGPAPCGGCTRRRGFESSAGTEPARRSGFATNEGRAAREAAPAFQIEPPAPRRRLSGITSLKQVKDRTQPTWIVGGNDTIFDYYGIRVDDLRAKGGGIMPPQGSGPTRVSREKRASGDVFIGTGLLANTPEQRSWYEASQLNDLVFLDMDGPLLEKLARVPGFERATAPLALSGVWIGRSPQ